MRGTVHTLYQIHCVGARRYSVGTMRGIVHTLYQIRCVGARRYSVGTERYCAHIVSYTLCRSSEGQCRYREVHTLSDRGNARTVLQRQASVCMYRGTVCVFDERRFDFEQSVFNTRRANAQTTHIQVQNYQIVSVMSLKYTPVTQSMPCLMSLMCVASIHHLTTVDKNLKTICRL